MSQAGLFPPAAGHMGTDESGKGDYFGPLVVAGFYAPDDQEAVLAVVVPEDVLLSRWQRNDFDFLVNNAGIGIHASFMETTEEQFVRHQH